LKGRAPDSGHWKDVATAIETESTLVDQPQKTELEYRVIAINKSRRFAILAVVIISAAITPGSDVFSLFSLAIPLYLLFEIGVLLCYFTERKKRFSKNVNLEVPVSTRESDD
jgi:hypothetical protein